MHSSFVNEQLGNDMYVNTATWMIVHDTFSGHLLAAGRTVLLKRSIELNIHRNISASVEYERRKRRGHYVNRRRKKTQVFRTPWAILVA